MDFTLSSEEKQIRNSAEKLAERHFADDAFTHFGDVPSDHGDILAEHGYLGMTIPQEYGGMGSSFFETTLAMEGVGRVCPETATLIFATNLGNISIVAEFADEKYREQYLLPITEGEHLRPIATAMSEPQAGSAVTDLSTIAEDDGDELILNGDKIWVTGAEKAIAFNTYVRFKDGNVGTVLIDADTPGFEIQEPMSNMAGEAQYQIFIDDAHISKDRVLVSGQDSFKEAIKYYNLNRVFSTARNWVFAKWLLDESIEYCQQRKTWDTPISEYQGVSHRLSRMAMKLETTRWLIYRALSDDDIPGRALSCMVKAYGCEKLHEVADAALQNKAANGFVGDTPESYAYRKLRGSRIAGGTTNIHLNNIAKSLYNEGYPEVE